MTASKLKRLTETEAATLTRREILDRIEAETEYWNRHRIKTDRDRENYAVFSRILHKYLNPGDGLDAARDCMEGRPNDYWEQRPGEA